MLIKFYLITKVFFSITLGNPLNIIKPVKEIEGYISMIMTLWIKLKCAVLPSLKPTVPKILQNNAHYETTSPRCNSSYVGQTPYIIYISILSKEHLETKDKLRLFFKLLDSSNLKPRKGKFAF